MQNLGGIKVTKSESILSLLQELSAPWSKDILFPFSHLGVKEKKEAGDLSGRANEQAKF